MPDDVVNLPDPESPQQRRPLLAANPAVLAVVLRAGLGGAKVKAEIPKPVRDEIRQLAADIEAALTPPV